MQVTWRYLLEFAMEINGESLNDVESYIVWVEKLAGDEIMVISNVDLLTLSKEELLDVVFDNGYGSSCQIQVKVWTSKFVYFSDEYDGSDFIGHVERNPVKEAENTEYVTYFI